MPVFTLQAQEGRLFAPLAFTKTYAMAAAAFLAITLVPVLMGLLIRGKIPSEENMFLNVWMKRLHAPVLRLAMRWRAATMIAALLLLAATA